MRNLKKKKQKTPQRGAANTEDERASEREREEREKKGPTISLCFHFLFFFLFLVNRTVLGKIRVANTVQRNLPFP